MLLTLQLFDAFVVLGRFIFRFELKLLLGWIYLDPTAFDLLFDFIVDLLNPPMLFLLQNLYFTFVLQEILSNILAHINLYLFVQHRDVDP
jgi:hypothetical protein